MVKCLQNISTILFYLRQFCKIATTKISKIFSELDNVDNESIINNLLRACMVPI